MSFLAEVMVHSGLFIGFLPLFFFYYVAPTQASSLSNDFFNMLTPYLNDISLGMKNPNTEYQPFAQDVDMLEKTAVNALNPFTQWLTPRNNNTKKTVAIVAGVLSPLLIIGGCIIEVYSGGNLGQFLIANLIVLTFIVASEFAIVGLFLKNFVEIDPEFIKGIFAKKMSQYQGGCWYSNTFIRSIVPAWLANKFLLTPPSNW
jgi:hypothetical protein